MIPSQTKPEDHDHSESDQLNGSLSKNEENHPPQKQEPILIVLTEGKEINDVLDLHAIFDAFVLSSWLPEIYDVKISKVIGEEPPAYQTSLKINLHHNMSSQKVTFVENSRTLKKQKEANLVSDILSKRHQKVMQQIKKEECQIDHEKHAQQTKLIDEFNERYSQQNGVDMFAILKNTPIRNHEQGDIIPNENVTFIGEIQYSVELKEDPNTRPFKVTVQFFIIRPKNVLIHIEGSEFLSFLQIDDQNSFTSSAWTRRPNELYYPYIEPENVRTKAMEQVGPHFSLAFRGGGAKGAAYIGAVKALLDDNPKVPIKSIIGSSSGAMLALAIAAGCGRESAQLVNHCKKMTEIPKDTYFKNQREIPEEINKIKQSIKQAFVDYGLLPKEALGMLDQIFTQQFTSMLLDRLSYSLDGVGEMFQFNNAQGIIKQKRNYYGLLKGILLAGETIEEIVLDIIREFLRKDGSANAKQLQRFEAIEAKRQTSKDFSKRYRKLTEDEQAPPSPEKPKIPPEKALTLKQFYQMTGIEFTVTAVDLDSQVLRFFNHKTTPSLPVYKAVVISGSYPVAFQAQTWDNSWGKYHIYYDRWCRVIDLEGHQFTDGGMLANIPMMYLDNESMCPKYFAHKCYPPGHESETKIIGFGLADAEDHINDERIKKEKERLNKPILDYLEKKLGGYWQRFKIAWKFYWADKPESIAPIDFKKIPLLGFGYKLLQTYINAGDNLVREWFEKDICFESPYKSVARILESNDDQRANEGMSAENILTISQEMDQLINQIEREANVIQNLLEEIWRIRNTLMQTSIAAKHQQSSFSDYKHRVRDILRHLKNLYDRRARIIINGVRPWSEAKKLEILIIQNAIKMGDRELLKIEQIPNFEPFICCFQPPENIAKLVVTCNSILSHFYIRKNLSEQGNRNDRLVHYDLDVELKKWFSSPIRTILDNFSARLQKQMVDTRRYEVAEKLLFEVRQPKIRAYINRKINKPDTSKNLHLIFQGIGENNTFSYQIFKLVEDCIFKNRYDVQHSLFIEAAEQIASIEFEGMQRIKRYNMTLQLIQQLSMNLTKILHKGQIHLKKSSIQVSEKVRTILLNLQNRVSEGSNDGKSEFAITSITSNSMHCFMSFLLTTYLKPKDIEDELMAMKTAFNPTDIFDKNFNEIISDFDKNEWLLPLKCYINKNFQNNLWNDRKDLFTSLQRQIGSFSSNAPTREDLNESLKKVQEEFEDSKEDIMRSYDKILEQLLTNVGGEDMKMQDVVKKLREQMSLSESKKDFLESNAEISTETKKFVNTVLQGFEEQIKYFLMQFASNYEHDILNLKLSRKQQKDAWKCMLLGRFLKSEELKRKVQNILLKMNLPKDISLKDYYNHAPRKIELTFPAVDINYRKLRFINQKTLPQMPVWAAVVIGSSLPMIFPTFTIQPHWCNNIDPNSNIRYLKNFFKETRYTNPPIFVSGNLISSFPLDLLTHHKLQAKFFEHKNYTLLCFGVDTSSVIGQEIKRPQRKLLRKYLSVSQLSDIIGLLKSQLNQFDTSRSIRLKMLLTYMEAHDNLAVELYKKELLQLPVRLSTLSFTKFRMAGDYQNPALVNILDETYFTTKEKFAYLSQNEDPATFIQLESFDEIIPEQQVQLDSWWARAKNWFGRVPPPDAQTTVRKIALRFLSKERESKHYKKQYKIQYRFKNNDQWVPVTNNVIILTLENLSSDRQYNLFLLFEYAVDTIVDSRAEENHAYKIFKSQFVLRTQEIAGFIHKRLYINLLYSFPYRAVSSNALTLVGHVADRINLKYNQSDKSTFGLRCASVVNVTQTGLYCEYCCRQLQRQVPTFGVKEQCGHCKEWKGGIAFFCSAGETPGHDPLKRKYCLECCKDHAIVREGYSLHCKLGHPFIVENSTRRLINNRCEAICDLCDNYVDIFYQDADCNLSICTKCCSQFSVSRVA